jgi:GR25 family glycosyltransferase involved in LPS biosynthesis
MQVFVINLEHRKDKLNFMLSNIPKTIDINSINIFNAINGYDIKIPDWYNLINSEHLHGSYGCYMSHLSIIKQITEPTLIFEDDVIFDNSFDEKYTNLLTVLPTIEYDLFYLGGIDARKSLLYNRNHSIRKCSRTHRTHAYIVSGEKSAKKIANYLEDPKIWHKFLLKKYYHIDHLYGQLQYKNMIQCYRIYPFICGQNECEISDVSPEIGPLPVRW